MHPKSHDIAIAAYQDTIEVWSSSSPTSFYSPQENNPSLLTSKTWSPTFIVWHLFYLQPHPFLNTNYLVGIGYRDVTKQAVIMLFEKTDTETFTHCLPFDLFSYPSLVLAFPLPFCFETFCIVTELYLIVCKVPDIMNGNTSLKRITLPDTCDKMSGYCTIPDCITESFYLISQTGVLYKASLNYSPIKLQSLSILDPHLMYIGKDTIESKPVDILLAYSDRCDWLLLLVSVSIVVF
ncbi:hypothetical protein HMI54_012229 [Coelomomyces lativittatus]|nr:hypothetical protein HMI54_012229 [Coelomomyces lativittatus]